MIAGHRYPHIFFHLYYDLYMSEWAGFKLWHLIPKRILNVIHLSESSNTTQEVNGQPSINLQLAKIQPNINAAKNAVN